MNDAAWVKQARMKGFLSTRGSFPYPSMAVFMATHGSNPKENPSLDPIWLSPAVYLAP